MKSSNPLKIAAPLKALARRMDSVSPDKNNANSHPTENLVAIKNSLAQFGQLKPIVVDSKGKILAGNGTWLAAKELGATEIAALVIPKELEGKAEEFALADNQTGRLSNWNPARLAAAIERIKGNGTAPSALGFDEKMQKAIKDTVKRITTRDSAWKEAAEKIEAKVRPGEIWELGEHRLLCGDARDKVAINRLFGGRTAALVFTDPPYGVAYNDSKGQRIKGDTLTGNALTSLVGDALKNLAQHAAFDAAWYIWHAMSTRQEFDQALRMVGLREISTIIWAKPGFAPGWGDFQNSYEPCYYATMGKGRPKFYGSRAETTLWRIAMRQEGAAMVATLGTGVTVQDAAGNEIHISPKGSSTKKSVRPLTLAQETPLLIDLGGNGNLWEVSHATGKMVHPNQKPIELARRALELSSAPGELVADVFAGSGSTLAAAELTGRCAFLVERDPHHASGIVDRWEKMVKRKAKRL